MPFFRPQSRLARKIAIAAFLISLFCTIVSSGILVFIELRQGQAKINNEIAELGRTNSGSIALSLWVLNMDLVKAQLKGLSQLPFISHARIRHDGGQIASGQAAEKDDCPVAVFPLVFDDQDRLVELGHLELCPDYGPLKERLVASISKIFFIELVFALTIALAIFLLFFRFVGRHIESIAGQAQKLSPDNLDTEITLDRSQPADAKKDELDVLATALNSMRINLQHAIREQQKKDAQHRTLFETMHQGVVYYDAGGRLITANPAALKILDLSRETLVGKNPMESHGPCVHEDLSEFTRDEHPALKALTLRKPVTGVVMGITGRAEGVRWLSVTAIPLFRQGNGLPYQVHVTFEDISRRKEAEEILQRYEQIISSTDDLMSFVDKQYVYKAVNNAYLKAHQKKQEEIVGQSVETLAGSEIFHGKIKENMDKALSGQTISYQSWFEYQGIGRRYMKVIYHPFADSSGIITGVVVCVHDLTEAKEAETRLIESELKYKVLFDNMAQGVFYQQADGKITDFNANALKMFGLSADQLLGRISYDPAWQVVREDGSPLPPELHPSMVALTTGQAVRDAVAGVFNPVTQSWRWLSINAIPQFRGKEAKPFQVFVTMHDITDLRQVEADLQDSHERFLTVLNSIDAFIYVSDFHTHEVLFMNQAMKDWYGEDYTGQICHEVFRKADSPCQDCTNQLLVDRSGQPLDVHVWTGQDQDTGKWYINHDRAIQWTSGQIVRLHIATDITDLRQMENDLRQAQKMESIGTLAGGVAHDFNNILSIILGNAELALDEVDSWHPVHSHIGEIKTASLRAKGVIRQLLNFSRKTEYEQVSMDLSKVMTETLTLLRSSIPSNIQIYAKIPEAVDFRVLADPNQIHQVFMNLCTNAYQAMLDSGGVIEVGLTQVRIENREWRQIRNLPLKHYVEIMVKDNGPGIPADLMDRIFDPYFTTKDVGQGTGLGLAVVQGIVQNHNGFVHVASASGEGTAFYILLPAGHGAMAGEEGEGAPALVPDTGAKILVVDDEKGVAEVTRQFLERMGHQVDVQTDPVKAAAIVTAQPAAYDLLLTDMTMPEMNGLTLSEIVRKVRPDLPIIICTGHGPQVSENRAKDLSIHAFATKPLTLSELSKLIQGALATDPSRA